MNYKNRLKGDEKGDKKSEIVDFEQLPTAKRLE